MPVVEVLLLLERAGGEVVARAAGGVEGKEPLLRSCGRAGQQLPGLCLLIPRGRVDVHALMVSRPSAMAMTTAGQQQSSGHQSRGQGRRGRRDAQGAPSQSGDAQADERGLEDQRGGSERIVPVADVILDAGQPDPPAPQVGDDARGAHEGGGRPGELEPPAPREQEREHGGAPDQSQEHDADVGGGVELRLDLGGVGDRDAEQASDGGQARPAVGDRRARMAARRGNLACRRPGLLGGLGWRGDGHGRRV